MAVGFGEDQSFGNFFARREYLHFHGIFHSLDDLPDFLPLLRLMNAAGASYATGFFGVPYDFGTGTTRTPQSLDSFVLRIGP